MKTILIALALGGTAVAAPGADFLAANPPPPAHPDLAASPPSRTMRPIEPTDIVAFAESSTVLLDAAQAQIDTVGAWLKKHPEANIVLEGHTDAAGSPTYNEGLALGRAQSVADRLVQSGVPANRIILVAWGEQQATHPQNLNDRRVVMYATRSGGQVIASRSLKRGALRAAWYANGSRFDMVVQGAL